MVKNSTTEERCPKCQAPLVVKMGRYGKFLACSKFPECHYTKSLNNEIGIKCPKCGTGEIIERRTKKRKIFYGCSNYPQCDFIINKKPINEFCPKCHYPLIQANKTNYKCSNKNCDYVRRIDTNI